MKKIIFAIIFLLIGVFCLSSMSRLTDYISDKIVADSGSSVTGNGTTNEDGDSSTGNGSSGNGDTSNSVERFFAVSEPLKCNYFVDTSSYEQSEDKYYYRLKCSESYYVCSNQLLEGDFLINDAYSEVYIKTTQENVSSVESKQYSVLIDLLDCNSNNIEIYFFVTPKNKSFEIIPSSLNTIVQGSFSYGWSFETVDESNKVCFIKTYGTFNNYSQYHYYRVTRKVYALTLLEVESGEDNWDSQFGYSGLELIEINEDGL